MFARLYQYSAVLPDVLGTTQFDAESPGGEVQDLMYAFFIGCEHDLDEKFMLYDGRARRCVAAQHFAMAEDPLRFVFYFEQFRQISQ